MIINNNRPMWIPCTMYTLDGRVLFFWDAVQWGEYPPGVRYTAWDSSGNMATGFLGDPDENGVFDVYQSVSLLSPGWESIDAGFNYNDIERAEVEGFGGIVKTGATAESTTISDVRSGAEINPGDHFLISSPSGDYYVWFRVDGIGEAPTSFGSSGNGTFYPAAGADDGCWNAGSFYVNSAYMIFGNGGQPFNTFIRFPNVALPPGANITTCLLELTAAGVTAGDDCNVNIHFNDSDSAVAPTSVSEGNALILTEAVPWDGIPHWSPPTGDVEPGIGGKYTSPELKAILQPVVGRTGFLSGSALQVIIRDNGSSGSAFRQAFQAGYGWGSNKAKLYVEYAAGHGLLFGGEGIRVDILSTDSAHEVALKIAAALNGFASGSVFDVPTPDGAALTVTNIVTGISINDPSPGTAAFGINATLGTESVRWIIPSASMTLNGYPPGYNVYGIPASAMTLLARNPSIVWSLPASAYPASQIIHICTLTGRQDGLDDLILPMSSFQCRLRDGDPSYLSCVIPNSLNYDLAITARQNGEIVIRKGFRLRDGTVHLEEIARVDFESLQIDRGARNDSATIVGHKTISSTALKDREVSGLSYYGLQATGKRVIRADMDLFLRCGDTCIYGDNSFIVGQIVYMVSAKPPMCIMEVTER